MVYKVVIVPKAAKEIREAAAWYGAESEAHAATWRGELLSHLATLEELPHRAPRLMQESQIIKKDIRQLIHGTGRAQYRILFEIRSDVVIILSIRHTCRQPDYHP